MSTIKKALVDSTHTILAIHNNILQYTNESIEGKTERIMSSFIKLINVL